jgi:hypothetical protein
LLEFKTGDGAGWDASGAGRLLVPPGLLAAEVILRLSAIQNPSETVYCTVRAGSARIEAGAMVATLFPVFGPGFQQSGEKQCGKITT